MRQLSGLSGLYRSRYCQTDHAKCARHRVLEANGATRVPTDLRPSDHVVADELIKLAHA